MLRMFANARLKGRQNLKVGLITSDQQTGDMFGDFLSDRDGATLELLDENSGNSLDKGRYSILVYDLDTTKKNSVRRFDHFMRERPPAVPVIVLSPSVDDEMVRWFLRLRVADWIKTPLSPAELLAACVRVVGHAPTAKGQLKCITFIGAKGGVGTTTLAIHAGLLLADAKRGGGATCVIDLDLHQGACADYLDLKQNWKLDELIPNPERLDSHLLEVMLSRHESGLAVLASQLPHHEPAPYEPEVITSVLDLACAEFANLVIDLPRYAAPWTESVILGSSHHFIVTDFSIPGLKSAKRMVNEIAEMSEGAVRPKVIVNKYERSIFGSGISNHEVKRILGDALVGHIPAAPYLVREAIDRGIPTTAIKAKNPIVTGLSKILDAELAPAMASRTAAK